MKSYQVVEWGAPLEPRTLETPAPQGREVLVDVAACGVCHSDVHIADGAFDLGGGRAIRMADVTTLPFTMGHEIAGTVAAVGPEVRAVTPGARVVVYPWIGCGVCRACRAGRDPDCAANRNLGSKRPGGYSDAVLVPDEKYVLAYGRLEPQRAATLACSGLTAYSALRKLPALTADDALVIIGAGGVGLAAVALASAITPATIVVSDVDEAKLEAARRAGAHHVVDAREGKLVQQVRKTLGLWPAAAIDFVGAPQTVEGALATVVAGGTVVVVGLFGGSIELALPLLPMRNLTLRGSYVGTLEELRELLALAEGRPGVPVTTRPMAEVNAALDDLRAGRIVGRVVLASS